MSVYGAQFEYVLSSAIENFRRELGAIASRHAADKQFHSGATLIKYQQAAYATLEGYADMLLPILTAFPNEHSPVQKADFDLARGSIESLRAAVEAEYADKAAKVKGAGAGAFVSGAKLDQLQRSAVSKITVAEEFCRSERSFWKWAFGSAQKQTWTFLVSSVIASASGVIGLFIGRLM